MERIHNQRGWISLLSISAIAFTLVGAYFVFDGNLGFIERLYDQASINMLVELVLLFICLELWRDICGYGGAVVTSGTSSDSDCRIIFFWAGGYRRGYPFIL